MIVITTTPTDWYPMLVLALVLYLVLSIFLGDKVILFRPGKAINDKIRSLPMWGRDLAFFGPLGLIFFGYLMLTGWTVFQALGIALLFTVIARIVAWDNERTWNKTKKLL